MSQVDEKGVTREAKLRQAKKAVEGSEMPDAAAYAWAHFLDLNQGRQAGFGLLPLTWSDIQAWASLKRLDLGDHDLRLIRAFDRAFLHVYATEQKEQAK